MLAGPCCETWSVARFNTTVKGPPPLRSRAQPLGLDNLQARFHQQCLAANKLLYNTLRLCLVVIVSGGFALIEHPAITRLHDAELDGIGSPPSIWRLQEMRALAVLPCASTYTFEKGFYGQVAKKPTTLLLVRLPTLPANFEELKTPPSSLRSLTGRGNQ